MHQCAEVRGGSATYITPAVLDRFEQLVIILLWSLMAWRMVDSPGVWGWLALASEGAILAFVLIRRPAQGIALNLKDWMLAFAATGAPLLVQPGVQPVTWLVPIGLALMIAGNLVSIWAKLVLRRSFGIAPANRGLKLSGPYRLVRHPMYGGYLIMQVGILILMPSWFNLGLYLVAWGLQIRRLLAEESLLGEDARYVAYKHDVRYRLVPGLY